jgi:hypothetical protein
LDFKNATQSAGEPHVVNFAVAVKTQPSMVTVRSPWREGANGSARARVCCGEANARFDGKSALQEEAMSTSQYYVVGNNDVWMIQFKGTENGQHKSSNEAILFAIATAQKLGMRGERAHVCVLDGDGRLRCKWSYNREKITCARVP